MRSPISYNIFKRISVSKKVFERIREVKPRKLYLFSDGPRNSHESILIEQNRNQILEMIDWDCDLRIHFLQENIGIENMWDLTFAEVFKEDDRIIVLEEDILPSLDFFRFCDELLEYYKDDTRVYKIGGYNALGEYTSDSNHSYFFSEVASSWGMATWRRVYESIDKNVNILDDPYYSSIIKDRFKMSAGGLHWYKHLKMLNSRPDLAIDSAEFWFLGLNENILFSQVSIIPSLNLISNLGNSDGAEHSDENKVLTKSQRLPYLTKILKLDFPLNHPKYMMVDYLFYRKVVELSKRNALLKFLDKIERSYRIIRYKGVKNFIIKLNNYSKRIVKIIRFYIGL
jgi:hypothetical protein